MPVSASQGVLRFTASSLAWVCCWPEGGIPTPLLKLMHAAARLNVLTLAPHIAPRDGVSSSSSRDDINERTALTQLRIDRCLRLACGLLRVPNASPLLSFVQCIPDFSRAYEGRSCAETGPLAIFPRR